MIRMIGKEGLLEDFLIKDNVQLRCDIMPAESAPGVEHPSNYECKFVERLDLLHERSTDPISEIVAVNVKQDKMRKNSANFTASVSMMRDDPILGGFELDLKPGLKCSTRKGMWWGSILDCE